MPITINGDGTITGLAVGGLPDGSVDTDSLASNAVTNAKMANSSVNSNQIVNGAVGAAEISNLFSGGAINIGGLRIVTGSQTLDGTASLSNGWYYNSFNISYSGFASVPNIAVSPTMGYHDAFTAGYEAVTTTSARIFMTCLREAGVESRTFTWIAIGQAS